MKKIFAAIIVFAAVNASANENIPVTRYQTVKAAAHKEQINPLLATAQFKFPSSVRTVGDAVEVVLHDSGFSLIPKNKQSIHVKNTLLKPLPITNKMLGPIEIKEALEVLMGKNVFYLVEDPLNRLVDFKLRPTIAKALGVKNG